jgi:hypothetical protein
MTRYRAEAVFQKYLVAERTAHRKPDQMVHLERWDEHDKAGE